MKKTFAYMVIIALCLSTGRAVIPLCADAVAHIVWHRQHILTHHHPHHSHGKKHHDHHNHLEKDLQKMAETENDDAGSLPFVPEFEKTFQVLTGNASFAFEWTLYIKTIRGCRVPVFPDVFRSIPTPPPRKGISLL